MWLLLARSTALRVGLKTRSIWTDRQPGVCREALGGLEERASALGLGLWALSTVQVLGDSCSVPWLDPFQMERGPGHPN